MKVPAEIQRISKLNSPIKSNINEIIITGSRFICVFFPKQNMELKGLVIPMQPTRGQVTIRSLKYI